MSHFYTNKKVKKRSTNTPYHYYNSYLHKIELIYYG